MLPKDVTTALNVNSLNAFIQFLSPFVNNPQ